MKLSDTLSDTQTTLLSPSSKHSTQVLGPLTHVDCYDSNGRVLQDRLALKFQQLSDTQSECTSSGDVSPLSPPSTLSSSSSLSDSFTRGSFSSASSADQEPSSALSLTHNLRKPLFGFFNVIRSAMSSTGLTRKLQALSFWVRQRHQGQVRKFDDKQRSQHTECKTVRQLHAELNALFVDAKKSGFVLQTSCPADDQPLDLASEKSNPLPSSFMIGPYQLRARSVAESELADEEVPGAFLHVVDHQHDRSDMIALRAAYNCETGRLLQGSFNKTRSVFNSIDDKQRCQQHREQRPCGN